MLDDKSNLTPMEQAPYDSERLLQELLANHPDILAGEQINSKNPRRWLLVTREMSVPDEVDGTGRWSLDHLFLDQEGIPTLVEVKRSSDTRIRREVVGQMLDYAANAVAYWPVEQIRAVFESRCESEGLIPAKELSNLLSEDHDPNAFWQQVKTNLQAGRIRLVFVADEIPNELRRIVEFLNKHLDPVEVLAVEIKQFIGGGMKTLVPRVIGFVDKDPSGGRKAFPKTISESEFLRELNSKLSPLESRVAISILDWSRRHGMVDNFTMYQRGAAFMPEARRGDGVYPFYVQTWGMLMVSISSLRRLPPFDDECRRDELLAKLQQLPGLIATEKARDGFPMIPLKQLAEKPILDKLLEILNWILTSLRGAADKEARESTFTSNAGTVMD